MLFQRPRIIAPVSTALVPLQLCSLLHIQVGEDTVLLFKKKTSGTHGHSGLTSAHTKSTRFGRGRDVAPTRHVGTKGLYFVVTKYIRYYCKYPRPYNSAARSQSFILQNCFQKISKIFRKYEQLKKL